ncbi:MAG: helix-turn-helix domain-containing protein, partial [Blastomonas fulva]
MRFKGLDLNLLVAFSCLMETRSVSRAAEQVHLSQPEMSAALSRLREYFGDDLLVLQWPAHWLGLLGSRSCAHLPLACLGPCRPDLAAPPPRV